ncbi:MAG: DUF1592 domain-containing protein [Acidobacteriota bacterium]|nr:DUF1592 domain-containing protein [Acidobacteriota bacterium]
MTRGRLWLVAALVPLASALCVESAESPERAVLDRYCASCHDERKQTAGLDLSALDLDNVGEAAEVWEKVVRKLGARLMPPPGRPRPDDRAYDSLVDRLEGELDAAWTQHPDPGRTQALHRLNRTEYRNAIRDLLDLELEIVDFLPADDASHGFDNMAGTLRMSEALMERYLSAARTISRMAIGSAPPAVDSTVYRTAQDLQQHNRDETLPFGTRGGLQIRHFFPQDAEYEFRISVGRTRGLPAPHTLELALDGTPVQLFAVGLKADSATGQPVTSNTTTVPYRTDGKFEARIRIAAGPREVAVAFHKKPTPLVEQVRAVFENPTISGNRGIGGPMPTVTSVTIQGPYTPTGSGDTPSQRRVFVCRPSEPAQQEPCARTILGTLVRRAYRGKATAEDLELLLGFYRDGSSAGRFEDGIELALRRLLVSPEFLYRIELDREEPVAPRQHDFQGTRIGSLDLASRLSFFLWSSIPDDELLRVAERDGLDDPDELERQARRMLADPRSLAMTRNFAGQWLQLRNLETIVRPGDPYSLAFDESLRRGLVRETELFLDSILREDRSLLEVLTANYTFLNERVARHYGHAEVLGSHFRRVALEASSPRRGLLWHGSVLTLTSHAIRTSPVNRGKWILDNLLGTPPPDPPPNIPALDDRKTQAKVATLRERMSQHRQNPACASCHDVIDPAGFGLENFDAIGRWRTVDESFNRIDASGVLPDGTEFDGVTELREALIRRPRQFVGTVTEKLMTYALGRGLEHTDMPVVRRIVSEAAEDDYRMQSLVLGIVRSYPFTHRSRS